MAKLFKWINHSDLAIKKTPTVGRAEYLDYMTFQANARPLFTEIFGPIIGLKEEWEAQGATAAELDFSAFPYRCEARHFLPVITGRLGGCPEETLEETGHRWKTTASTSKKPGKSGTVRPQSSCKSGAEHR